MEIKWIILRKHFFVEKCILEIQKNSYKEREKG